MGLLDTNADRLDWQEDGSVVFTLRKGLKTSSGEVLVLTAKRPTLDDLIASEKAVGDNLTRTATVTARLTGTKLAELDEIDGGDANVLAAVFAQMLEYGEDGHILDRHDDRLTITDHDASLTLRRPVMTLQGEAEEIVMRRPSLKEVRTNQAGTLANAVKMLALLSGIGPNVLGRIDAVDGLILSALVKDFLGEPRTSISGAP